MLSNDGSELTLRVDDDAALTRLGLLVETVAACVTQLLNAVSPTAVLPAVLTQVAKVVRIDRLVVVEITGGAGERQSSPSYLWSAAGNEDCEHLADAIRSAAADPALSAWLAPLSEGKPVLTVGRTAPACVQPYLTQLAVTNSLMVPVMLEGHHWGQIELHCGSEPEWAPHDVEIMTMLAGMIGAAITRERLLAGSAKATIERGQAEERIALLARTDVLTGVANRLIFGDRLRQAFAAAQRGASGFAVLYLDLDRFKEVNDTLGHHAGDQLLQQVARRLSAATREIDVVARLGGDEFAIIQAEVTNSAAAGTLAEKLIEIVSASYVVDGNELRIGVSIGIALWDHEATAPDALLAEADQALYRAKHAGRGQYRFHSEEIDHETREHLSLAEELRAALARDELEIRYQPQVELVSGRVVGMEALLRWNHPTRGLLLPEDFLPIAEKFGIMQQLGRWTLDGACRQLASWRQQQVSVPVMGINVAVAQIKQGAEFVRDVMESLERWGLQPSDIELDVTEQLLARSTLAQSEVLIELRRLGVGIAIDDFGSKYSSLDYLRTYHVSRLKIARGMVAAADVHPGGNAMIRAILSLAGELGLDVVAEGIETDVQRKVLVAASARAEGQIPQAARLGPR